jgi:hypothetical protein
MKRVVPGQDVVINRDDDDDEGIDLKQIPPAGGEQDEADLEKGKTVVSGDSSSSTAGEFGSGRNFEKEAKDVDGKEREFSRSSYSISLPAVVLTSVLLDVPIRLMLETNGLVCNPRYITAHRATCHMCNWHLLRDLVDCCSHLKQTEFIWASTTISSQPFLGSKQIVKRGMLVEIPRA